MRMLLMVIDDATSLSYWLRWRVLICAIVVLTPMFVALYLIWKYERPKPSESVEGMEGLRSSIVKNEDAWSPCVKGIPLSLLLVYRVIAFCLLLVALSFDVAVHSAGIFLFYTQWTFTLVTIYFGFGSLLSIYGCYQHKKGNKNVNHSAGLDTEKGIYMPLACDRNANVEMVKNSNYDRRPDTAQISAFWLYLYQIVFQMTAGAVMLTDCIYWCVIFPFLTILYYEMSFLTVVAHSLNAILLLGDTALNCLPFPWFRISYFILWTGVYVIFQWIFHACVPIGWPYPFLDLSRGYAPLWYLVVALMHLPCYGIFVLIVELKHYALSRWFPQSYLCHR